MGELLDRRERLFHLMQEDSVLILFAGVSKLMSEDATHPFMSNRNFFYLTGIEQENSILMMVKGIGGEKKAYLFIDEYDEVKEKWTGRRITEDEAMSISSIKSVYTTNSFENMLSMALSNSENQYGKIETLYLDLSPELKIKSSYSTHDFKDFISYEYPHVNTVDIYPIIRDLRMVKSSYEVEKIVRAINATNSGISQLIINLKPGIKEYELSDIFEFFGRKQDRKQLAFSTITAAGVNATCLHYPTQNCVIRENEMVLFDLGYKYEGYCADISRTYPVNGVFSGVQKDIYEAVLNCNKAVIDYVKSGMTLKQLQEFTKDFLKKECVRLHLMNEDEDINQYYYHGISHHLGLDTHDVSDREKPLENGNIITVEPGLYFKKHKCGVRIEDDVLISDGVGQCLSKGIAKEIKDIEKIFKTKY